MSTSGERAHRGSIDAPKRRCVGPTWTSATIVLIVTLAGTVRAEVTPSATDVPFIVKTWLATDGLPQSSVTALARTPDGYLWVGTAGGLARFDGVRFVNYGLSHGLRSLSIRALVEDGDGGPWVATLGGGRSRLRGDGTIATLPTADGLASNELSAIARDGSGLWVGSKKGLQRWTPGAGFVQV